MFFASTVTEATILGRRARLALAHAITVVWFAIELTVQASFALGLHRPSPQLVDGRQVRKVAPDSLSMQDARRRPFM